MAKNKSVLHKIFPTAHKVLLDRVLYDSWKEIKGDVLIVGAGFVDYKKLLFNAASVLVTDIEKYHANIDGVADIQNLPYQDKCFDCVIAIEVLEHVADSKAAVSELYRVLRDGGEAVLTIPYMFRVHADPYDYYRFTRFGLQALFSSFESLSIKPIGGRVHVISDIVTTASPVLIVFRLLNHLFCLRYLLDGPSRDCPSGYYVNVTK